MDPHPKIQQGPDGSLLLNFGSYGREIEVAAISGDGRRVLTVREVGVAEIRDAASGAKVGELRPTSPLEGAEGMAPGAGGFRVFIESAALDREGSTALLGLNDGTAGVFRVADGVRLATLHPPEEPPSSRWGVIRAVAYSPDGELALVGFPGRSVGVWSRHGELRVAFLVAPSGSRLVGSPFVRDSLTSSVAMSSDGRWVFAGHVDMTATIWDAQRGTAVFEAIEHAEDIVAVFDTGKEFGWATTGGSVWSARGDASPVRALASGEHWAEVCFAGDRILTRGFSDEIKLWDRAGTSETLFAAHERCGWSDAAATLAFHGSSLLHPAGGRRVVVRGPQATVHVDRDAQLVTARFSPDGRAVATEGWRDCVELWALPDGALLHEFTAPGGVGSFALSADGAQIAIGEIGQGGGLYTRCVRIYATTTGRELQHHAEHDWQVSCVAFSPDGRYLASLGDGLVLWDVAGQRVIARHDAARSARALQFLRDGRLVVLDDGSARVFDREREILAWAIPMRYGTRWCISDDERMLSVALDQAIAQFDLDTGALCGTRVARIPRPESVPTEAIAQEVSAHSGAALWRTEYGLYLHQSDGPRGWVQPLQLSLEGVVAVPAEDGAAILRVDRAVVLLGIVTFVGKLRASRVVDGDMLLVNHAGQLFRHRIPASS
jgi:WD40 repeat protein